MKSYKTLFKNQLIEIINNFSIHTELKLINEVIYFDLKYD
jgi:hypothetical protein